MSGLVYNCFMCTAASDRPLAEQNNVVFCFRENRVFRLLCVMGASFMYLSNLQHNMPSFIRLKRTDFTPVLLLIPE